MAYKDLEEYLTARVENMEKWVKENIGKKDVTYTTKKAQSYRDLINEYHRVAEDGINYDKKEVEEVEVKDEELPF